MEQDLLLWITEHYKVFALVTVRIGSLIFLMPVFSSATLPVQVKAAATLVIALLLTPVVQFTPEQFPSNPWEFGLLAVKELFVGMTLALIVRLVFAGLQMAGQLVGFQMGLSVANVVDPQSGTQSIIISQMAYIIALLLFLVSNGHHLILKTFYESFSILPPGELNLQQPLATLLMDMSQEMFVLSVKLMAPVMAILLFSQVALGILAKTVPQMNMLILSFGLNVALGLFFFGLTLQIFWPVLGRSLERGIRLVPVAMKIMAGH